MPNQNLWIVKVWRALPAFFSGFWKGISKRDSIQKQQSDSSGRKVKVPVSDYKVTYNLSEDELVREVSQKAVSIWDDDEGRYVLVSSTSWGKDKIDQPIIRKKIEESKGERGVFFWYSSISLGIISVALGLLYAYDYITTKQSDPFFLYGLLFTLPIWGYMFGANVSGKVYSLQTHLIKWCTVYIYISGVIITVALGWIAYTLISQTIQNIGLKEIGLIIIGLLLILIFRKK